MKKGYILVGLISLLFSGCAHHSVKNPQYSKGNAVITSSIQESVSIQDIDTCGEGKYLNEKSNKCKSLVDKKEGVVTEIICEGNLTSFGHCDKQNLHIALENGSFIDYIVNDSSFQVGDKIDVIVEPGSKPVPTLY